MFFTTWYVQTEMEKAEKDITNNWWRGTSFTPKILERIDIFWQRYQSCNMKELVSRQSYVNRVTEGKVKVVEVIWTVVRKCSLQT